MRFHRGRVAGATILGLALLASACGSSGGGTKKSASSTSKAKSTPIVVGSEKFSESVIVNEIYARALETKGYKVTRKLRLGTREIYEPALERGEIDLVGDYAATMLEFVNKNAGEATPDPTATVSKLNEHLAAKKLVALDPAPAIDANAFAVRKDTAQKYNLTKLSDLAPVAGQLTLGAPPECPTRKFCGLGLKDKYGITFKSFKGIEGFDGPLVKAALKRGDIDVAEVATTDGEMNDLGFVILQDDKHLQNADNITPVIRSAVATSDVKSILNKVSAALTTNDLAQLDKRADVDKEDPEAVADSWAKDHGF